MGAIRKIFYRAPRYVLSPQDSRIVRVAPRNRRKNQIYQMEILDISESGMAFIVNWHYLPRIGEILKVEFQVPGGGNTIAWFARVVRLESETERPTRMGHFSGVKVAVEFIDLPKKNLKLIKDGLNIRFVQDRKEHQRIIWNRRLKKGSRITLQFFGIVFLMCVMFYFFKYITKENALYNSQHPSNWGERFFDQVIPKEK